MFERYDIDELLALIEGTLDAERAASLRAQLEQDPASLARVEAMIADRQALSALSTPAMPGSLIAGLESRLARPMLIETLLEDSHEVVAHPAGSYRRSHRRKRPVALIGLAASVGILVTAGLVLFLNSTWRSGESSPLELVSVEGVEQPGNSDPRDLAATNADLLAHASIHHLPPRLEGITFGAETGKSPTAADRPLALDFAVVVISHEGGSAAEDDLWATINSDQATLVRNFSFEEAQRLASVNRVRRGGEPREPAVATLGDVPDAMRNLAAQTREQIRFDSDGADAHDASGVISGDAQFGATLAEQLNYARRGATHTMTIRKEELMAWLGRLQASTRLQTMIRLLETPATPLGTSTVDVRDADGLSWLADRSAVSSLIADLDALPDDALIHVPLVVQSRE